jgi:hypothetical protein
MYVSDLHLLFNLEAGTAEDLTSENSTTKIPMTKHVTKEVFTPVEIVTTAAHTIGSVHKL